MLREGNSFTLLTQHQFFYPPVLRFNIKISVTKIIGEIRHNYLYMDMTAIRTVYVFAVHFSSVGFFSPHSILIVNKCWQETLPPTMM